MDSAYDPQQVESLWYERWEAAGAFRPELNPSGDPFCVVIPPPNVTGSLHMGHALNLSIQDAIIRRRRMLGDAVLWVPGMDHAGIATQNVVERELAAEGLTRHEVGREAFLETVWAWKARSGGRITEQIRRLGFSTDWSRERFTMDEGLSRAVRTVFVRLYEEGLIYRGDRIINWCPRCHTALSEIEVEHSEVQGELVRIRYPFTDGEGGVEVATTRAETMLGDTGVAVHPDDDRYRHLVGRTVRLPLLGREIPIVADEAVDPEFGTGAVKVTPAHDAIDFEIAGRAGLEAIKVLDLAGVVNAAGGPFAGQDRFEARRAVKLALEAEGALVGVEPHDHSVGHCYRCGTVVEPYLSLQWFVKVRPLVIPAIEAVRSGEITFYPRRWENAYFNWMENLRDWCVSRQIWWGHRIPAWYCDDCDRTIVAMDGPAECPSCGGASLRQDEDVLDTWFSSALWPFSTLGWPDQTADFESFYPNAVLVTGFDIIYFWVARMIKMGIHFAGAPPYPDVVIHGLVRAADGRKMSKSLGNALDPLDVVETHGADALRLALIQAAAPGQDVPLQMEWVDAARRFGNKLWNATRFVMQHVEPGSVPADAGYPDDPGDESAWILSRLASLVADADRLLDEYRFSDAYGQVYAFAWSEAFDWYLELAKARLRGEGAAKARVTLGVVLRDLLKLFHPVIPFLTEELWQHLVGEGMVATSRWPTPPAVEAPAGFEIFREVVTGLRRFRAEHGLGPRHPLDVVVADPDGVAADWWGEQLESLCGVSPGWQPESPDRDGRTRMVIGPLQVFISLEGIVDPAAERARLKKAIDDQTADLAKSEAKLANEKFVSRAPAEVVDRERHRVAEARERIDKLQAQYRSLA